MVGLDAEAGYRATASVLLVAVVGAARKQATELSALRFRESDYVDPIPCGRFQGCCVDL